MINCLDNLTFSNTHSKKRLEKAYEILGAGIVSKIIGFALFLLGANRNDIAKHLDIPLGTFFSFLTRIDKHGLSALEDRRKNPALHTRQIETHIDNVNISLSAFHKHDQDISIQFGNGNKSLKIPCDNSLQQKVVLLTFYNSGLLSANEVASVLGYSARHISELGHKMSEQDVHSLLDQRKGQLIDYRFTPEIKAELIQQFAANAITGQHTSSRALSEQLTIRCNIDLSDRSIRLHIKKLGLSQITKSLPELVDALKKTSVDNKKHRR